MNYFYLGNQELKTITKSNHYHGRLCRKIDKTGVLLEFLDMEYGSGNHFCQSFDGLACVKVLRVPMITIYVYRTCAIITRGLYTPSPRVTRILVPEKHRVMRKPC